MTRTPDEMFGLGVRERRDDKGWSMSEFASMLQSAGLTNFHATTVGRLERGERPVRLNEAVVIASVLGDTLDNMVVEPLVGDEEVRELMGYMESTSKEVGRGLRSLDLRRAQLKDALQTARQALKEGKILDDHVAQVQDTCREAESLLDRDLVQPWTDKFKGMNDEEFLDWIRSQPQSAR